MAAAATIEPNSFDVVVCGTGLPESILAAACAAAGKTVLHVDPNPFYGSLFSSSVPPHALPSFLLSSDSPSYTPSSDTGVVPLQRRSCSLYSDIEISGTVPSEGRFALDLVGPRLLYCADEAVDLLNRSGGGHHVEFKSVDLLYWDHGDLFPVPGSREDIFNTKLSEDIKVDLVDKNRLSAFVKLVKSHIAAKEGKEGEASIPEQDLDLPFVEFLKKQKLTPKMIRVVLYVIAMADYDQEDAAIEYCKKILTTRDGMKTVALYFKSTRRFVNAKGAFIYPMHGHGELPQAFCRFAAVKGALYVLRMHVTALLMDKGKQRYIGTRLSTGQDILCQQLILDPSYKFPSLDLASGASDSNSPRKVARGICITKKSVKQNLLNALVVFPPKSLQEKQIAALRVLQLSSNVAICPPEMFVAYLSIPCVDAYMGKLCINKAIDVLFGSQTSNGSNGVLEKTIEDNNAKQGLIWKCVYVQEITQRTPGAVLSCPMPDEYLDYRNILESTEKLFAEIYPNEEFLPRNSAPQHEDDDSDSVQ